MSASSRLIIRQATRDDDEQLIDLQHSLNLAEHAAYPRNTAIPRLLDVSRDAAVSGVAHNWAYIGTHGGAYLVGELDGVIVCCGCWYSETAAVSTLPEFQRQAGVGAIVVAEAARGQGLGRIMMTELEKCIAAEGINHVRLTVVPGNKPAEALYHSLGFENFEMVMIKTLA